jgi:hypothetical protein
MLGIYDETPKQAKAALEFGLESIPAVAANATFLNPGTDDEVEDWGNRGELLKRYRELKQLIK